MEREVADDKVEARLGEGQKLVVGEYMGTGAAAQDGRRALHFDQVFDPTASADDVAQQAVPRADLGGEREAAGDVVQAVGEEFAGKAEEAIGWYRKIIDGFPSSQMAKKATGAKRRLESVGKSIQLSGMGLDGKPVSLGAYQGRTVLIHYWATWCEPCKQDMVLLKALLAKYAKQGFTLIGVNLDSDRELAIGYLRSNPLPWPQLYEPGGLDSRLATELGVFTLPTMILIDKKGRVLNRNIHAGELDEELGKRLR